MLELSPVTTQHNVTPDEIPSSRKYTNVTKKQKRSC